MIEKYAAVELSQGHTLPQTIDCSLLVIVTTPTQLCLYIHMHAATIQGWLQFGVRLLFK